ncbi:hypothetical protein [Noviherbaspirillum denitrificans]|uniref:Uncharacterized protein n=1 Tax=Noviherbaspirillum denitrificans TaxID=1968433 RepID=A0A254TJX5_9BURK|nr:hypothetical protein [Noviherbaspirillum denitrificans]OWW20008.1 hypothetical protein AYR66_11380 [Noviherbaspirillum denitrificans]
MGWFTRNDVPAALLASVLLAPLAAAAADTGMHRLSEDDMRRVAAQGLADRFLQRIALYAANGIAIEVTGDTARLLNPVGDAFAGLLDADISFRDAMYNPANPATIVDRDGSVLVRLPSTVGEVGIRNIRVRGSNGASFGSVTIRDLDMGGTTIRVTQR